MEYIVQDSMIKFQILSPILDDFYALRNSGADHIPTRIPLSSFNSDLDLIKELFQPSNDQGISSRGQRPEPVVELASAKSGIKLVFDTNRA
jgi:aldose 1-epimerase